MPGGLESVHQTWDWFQGLKAGIVGKTAASLFLYSREASIPPPILASLVGLRIKHTAAAKVIQRAFQDFIGKVRAQREGAARHIQRVYRGHKARQWTQLVMSQEWDQLNAAVTAIQRTWRGFHARNLYRRTRAAVVVQRFVRGRQQVGIPKSGLSRRRFGAELEALDRKLQTLMSTARSSMSHDL